MSFCAFVSVLSACAHPAATVTSGVIVLAPKRDSEVIRNVNTQWSLLFYEFSLSLSLFVSLSFAFSVFNTHTHFLCSIISLGPCYE